ncbi:C13 family peptidase [Pontiellaceae bacterium B12227]|nr:C13 family peptidase [Pontiellaceae bacterium B12227]
MKTGNFILSRESWRALVLLMTVISILYTPLAFGADFTLKSKIYAGTYSGFADRLTITSGDIDGDGDPDIIGGFAQGGLVYLRNPEHHLAVSPPSATVVAGEPVSFSVLNAPETITWSIVQNASSGSIGSANGVFVSGPTHGSFDIIEARTEDGVYGRAYVNVIGLDDVSSAGKAIIVAGGKSLSDPVWPTSDYLADLAYSTLRYRGFSRDNLQYLSFGPDNDVDNNGILDDIDGFCDLYSVSNAITQWAIDAQRLFVYLTDHGGDSSGAGYFRLNTSELLTAYQLDLWLDALQDATDMDVTVVIDSCYSGSFIDELTYSGIADRLIVTSCGENELTYFLAGGAISFSDVFFHGLMQGFDVNVASGLGADAMSSYQTVQLSGDGGDLGGDTLGASFIVGRDFPTIGNVTENQILTGETEATLWVEEISSSYPIERAWCSIFEPNHSPDTNSALPVIDIPEVDLTYNASLRRYEADIAGFTENGTYQIRYYAEDIWGGVSYPRQSFVTQAGYDEKIIIVAGGDTNIPYWSSINNMANIAYSTAASRHLSSNSIYYICSDPAVDVDGDNISDVDALPSGTAISNAISGWAAGTDKLTVYIAADYQTNHCHLSATETLTATDLDSWLDDFQSSDQAVNVIMDFDNCGSFVPELTPPANKERIAIASTSSYSLAMKEANGWLSFSQSFFSHILNGETIGTAYVRAKRNVRLASGRLRQRSMLDDTGDGLASKYDGNIAGERYIGPAFLTGDDIPFIGTVMPDMVLPNTSNLVLWASNVSDVDGISNVWCMVTTPEFDGTNGIVELALDYNDGMNRHETEWNGFTTPGSYTLTFFAMDLTGEVSSPAQAMVYSADAFENDDSYDTATPIYIGEPQLHTFHSADDEDWVKFFAQSGTVYDIIADQLGTNIDIRLDVYYEPFVGPVTNVDPNIDDAWDGAGEYEEALVAITTNSLMETGVYYIRISSANTNMWGQQSEYDIELFNPSGAPGSLLVVAFDKKSGQPPPGAVAIVDGVSKTFNGSTSVSFTGLSNGVHTIEVPTVNGYMPELDPNTENAVYNTASWYGNPKEKEIIEDLWQQAVFQFVPMIRVEGQLRDGTTGGMIEGAAISFSGIVPPLTNTVNGFPDNATYKELWHTETDGHFPANTWLISSDWSLHISKPGFPGLTWSSAITNTAAGDVIDLGTLTLSPYDANTNGLGDQWEIDNLITDPFDDPDGDGLDNLSEYYCGTDPSDPYSLLELIGAGQDTSNGFTLYWSSIPGRTYAIASQPSLLTNQWTQISPSREAEAGQTEMQWTDPGGSESSNKFYKVQLITH